MSIVGIDMHIRDERVLASIRERAVGGAVQVPARDIAEEFRCHINTAQAILRRLAGAGHIEVDKSQFRGGYSYRVKEE